MAIIKRYTKAKTIPFTQDGYDKVKARYEELTNLRPQILVRLQAAREMGDLSENGAYTAARFELSSLDRELRRHTMLVRLGRVTQKAKTDKISFGSVVTLSDDKGDKVKFTLVGDHEAIPLEMKLSVGSPFGMAVVGKKLGDKVAVRAPNGVREFRIDLVE